MSSNAADVLASDLQQPNQCFSGVTMQTWIIFWEMWFESAPSCCRCKNTPFGRDFKQTLQTTFFEISDRFFRKPGGLAPDLWGVSWPKNNCFQGFWAFLSSGDIFGGFGHPLHVLISGLNVPFKEHHRGHIGHFKGQKMSKTDLQTPNYHNPQRFSI